MHSRGSLIRLFSAFGLLSLTTVLVGCTVARANGVGTASWSRNVAAWGIGALVAGIFSFQKSERFLRGLLIAAPLGLVATLLNEPVESVHRWVDLGPIHTNVAAILLPGAVVALAALEERWMWLVAVVIGVLLVLQPDASQATAFGVAAAIVLLRFPAPRAVRGAGVVAILALVAVAWLRPDPLAPVPEVEGMIGLAARWSPLAALLAVAGLASVVLAPLAVQAPRSASRALAAYFSLCALAPLAGAFPVPLVGMGMSPILGFWLGFGALLASARLRRSGAPELDEPRYSPLG